MNNLQIAELFAETDKINNSILDNISGLDSPKVVSDLCMKIGGIIYTLASIEADLEAEYYKKWEDLRKTVDTDGRANRQAKSTIIYKNLNTAKLKRKALVNLVSSLKKRQDVLLEEMRLGK